MIEENGKKKIIAEWCRFVVVLALTMVFLIVDAKFFSAKTRDGKVQDTGWETVQGNETGSNKEDQGESLTGNANEGVIGNTGNDSDEEQREENRTASKEQTQETSKEHTQDTAKEQATGADTKQPGQEETTQEPDSEAVTELESPQKPVYEFTQAPEGYFDDALFIGDSRTVGLYEYGGIEGADFFATTGMSVYNIDSEKVKLGDKGVIAFDNLITQYTYGKIYLMLGINELGYDMDETVDEYKALVERLRQTQPEAVIYVEANMHVSAKRSAQDAIYNNQNINYINEHISVLADNENIFYIDVNQLFDDEGGNLRADTTMDETHVLGRYYKQWANWLAENAIVK